MEKLKILVEWVVFFVYQTAILVVLLQFWLVLRQSRPILLQSTRILRQSTIILRQSNIKNKKLPNLGAFSIVLL
ncbi:hypothetical protein D0S48_07950 [Psychrobacillus sp. AK 1817]|nr:hypothetical protein D0S48_07950 [Psychrobacillus sp. AK 1817]